MEERLLNFYRVKNDTYGNPRYVVHYLDCLPTNNGDNSYSEALYLMRKIGGKKFHNKQFGGGIVFQSYNTQETASRIGEIIGCKCESVET